MATCPEFRCLTSGVHSKPARDEIQAALDDQRPKVRLPPEDALAFVNRFADPSISNLGAITFRDFRDLQNMVRIATRTPLSEWPPKDRSIESAAGVRQMVSPEMGGHLGLYPWRLSLRWDMTPPAFVHETYDGIEACCAQVFFEKLSGVEFRWCARADCGAIFRKETGHDKIYCTPDCAHLAAVRASRARANRASLKKRSRKRRWWSTIMQAPKD